MQDASGIGEEGHIITSSDANRKLSFQGWEKCVEAFSQGKGSLSHQCSRLMSQMDSSPLGTPRLDEVISWSSSDGECEESYAQQHMRLRPNRTLSSQINFDECKPLRERGRRHTSAQFVRSIDKRLTQETQSLDSRQCKSASSPKIKPSSHHENVEGSTRCEDQCLTPCSDPIDELVWMRNLSLLNQRINLSPLCSDSFNVTNTSGTEVGASTLNKTTDIDEENRSISPILGSHERKRHKRKKKWKSDKCQLSAIELDEAGSKCQTPGSQSTSPIFKTRSHLKRRECKVPGDRSCKFVNSLQSDLLPPAALRVNEGHKLICDKRLAETFNKAENTLLGAANENNALNKSPEVSKTPLPLVVSPVIGKSTRNLRKSLPKMKIDQSISPILGCKIKSVPTKRKKIEQSDCFKQRVMKDSIATILPNDFDKSQIEESSISGLPKVGLEKVAERIKPDNSNLFTTQSKVAVKRSLDFSYQNKTQDTKSRNFEAESLTKGLTVSHAEETSGGECNKSSNFNSKTPKLARRVNSPEFSNSFSHSYLIEEINTEQLPLEDFEGKPETPPTSSRKKKKLSLSRKSESKVETNKMSSLQIIKEKSSVQVPDCQRKVLSRECQPPHKQEFELPPKIPNLSSKKSDQQRKALTLSKRPQNLTLFIEEEFSEPLDNASQGFVPSVVHLQNHDSIFNKPATVTAESNYIPGRDGKKKTTCNEVDIDSCSSQSPEQSQLEQIERLPSPAPSSLSPLTISQMSSPPIPAVSNLPSEQLVDDFNAPPRRGKKKLKPDGLANRLQRLLNRQRSSSRIWQFKRSKQIRTSSSSTLGNQDQSTALLLIVDRTWNEYSHAIVQGHVHRGVSQSLINRLNALSQSLIVILDPYVAEQLGRIMLASIIRIFPPWQALKLRGTSVILGASCIEVVPGLSLEHVAENESLPSLNEGVENITGTILSEIIFPKVQENTFHLLQCANAEDLNDLEDPVKQNTISNTVSNHCVGGPTSDWLTLTILRSFHFRQTDKAGEKNCSAWSLLGRDSTGELCEIVLGCDESSSPNRSIWQDLKTERITGRTYNFSGFLPVQRISPFRVSNLWSVVSNMGLLEPCDQSVFYILGSSGYTWKCKPSENQRKIDLYHPFFSSLKEISSQHGLCESQRVNILCRVLHATNERLYITDLDTAPSITVLSVNPTAFVPSFSPKAVVSFLDVEIVSESLRADKYTRMLSIDATSIFPNNLYNEEQCRSLADLNPALPILDRNTPARSLVIFFGSICGVDEDSAFMWPACGICGNEVLSVGDSSEKYCCESCNGQSENFTLRMSLQVLATCTNLPEKSSIRIKLHQRTIESLLPASLCNEEGYDMNAVLGQKVGPLKCEVLLVKGGNFTLQELP